MPDHSAIHDLYYGSQRWDFRLGTYLGLLRTMTIADMVARLYSTTRLQTDTFNRLQRTRLLLTTLIVDGLESPQGAAALARMAAAHRNVRASNDEYRYVLSVFFLEPIRFNTHHGRARFSESDHAVLLSFWMRVGARMGIQELLPTLTAWSQFQGEYEAAHQGATDQGRALARAALYEVVKLTIPRGLQRLTRQILLGTMHEPVRDVLGLPAPSVPAALSLPLVRFAGRLRPPGATRALPRDPD
jgi:ER-bound oxygenase mpaB/B'/Rubber oxygenase, catalytic domain